MSSGLMPWIDLVVVTFDVDIKESLKANTKGDIQLTQELISSHV